ncbi:MAG: chromosomal replication initiator protein DnaA [Bryobacteraceae bacterium]
MDVWEQIKQHLAANLSKESFDNWFAATKLSARQGDCLWVSVPTDSAAAFIEQEYGSLIAEAIVDLRLPIRHVQFEAEPPLERAAQGNGDAGALARSPVIGLNPRLTFDTFVVGSSNQVAHAAARAVAEAPARAYNPLFVYAGSGLGKTHLLHAVSWEIQQRHPGLRLVFTSGERFMNDLVRSIRQQRMPSFHRTYRSADVLVVDDVHVLGGKEGTQEELFHTFNELYERDRQIILSSDCPPREIPGLVQRLRSRFEWGLMVAIQPPDLETKLAILDKKAHLEGVELPDDVRLLIATRSRASIRELEGALLRLRAYSSVTGAPITMQLAQQALRDLLPDRDRRISIEAIIKTVAGCFQLEPAQLKSRCNAQRIAFPRQVAMYLARELTTASLPEIARAFGGKHHTTVLHSIRKIDRLRDQDQDLNRLLHRLMDDLQ